MKTFKIRILGFILMAFGLMVVPVIVGTGSYVLQQLEYVLSLVLVAVGLNIVTGFAGQLSLGPGAIFAVAAYVSGVLANDFPSKFGLLAMCLVGIIAAVVVGFIIGVPALRIAGFYLGMVTLFAALVVPTIASNLGVAGGNNGISLVGNLNFYQHPSGPRLYELSVGIVLIVVLASGALLHSRVGHRFLVLRTSEELASSLGISVYRAKLLAFVLSSLPAGIGGALYVYTQQFISPGSVTTTISIYLLAACVIGGFGTVMGPLIGGLLIIGLSQFLGGFAQFQGIIFGLLLLIASIFFPGGILGFKKGLPGFRPALDQIFKLFRVNIATVNQTSDSMKTKQTVGENDEMNRPKGSGLSTPSLPLGVLEKNGLQEDHSQLLLQSKASLVLSAFRSEDTSSSTLIIKNLKHAFGGVVAVDGVDMTVRPQTIHGLIGSNGSGKTTLLNLISGYYHHDSGEILLDGTRIVGGPDTRARAGLGRTFQTPKLITELSVIDNIVSAAEMTVRTNGISSFLRLPSGRRADSKAVQLAHQCLETIGLDSLADEKAGELPHGLRRLVEVARVLALQPRILLLDEPAAGLNEIEVERLKSVLVAVREAGMSTLLIEHNVPFVLEVADYISVMHLGRCIASGLPDQIVADNDVAKAFLGRSDSDLSGEPANKMETDDLNDRYQFSQAIQNASDRDHTSSLQPQVQIQHTEIVRKDRSDLGGVALTVEKLSAGYGDMKVVSEASFRVESGELACLVGRNGAGKTTAISAIAGIRHTAPSGTVRLGDIDLSSARAPAILSSGLVLVPEGHRIFGEMKVIENLRLGAYSSKRRPDDISTQIARVFELFPILESFASMRASKLSGGQQQMLAIGQALMARPLALLLDEPSSGLAPSVVDAIYDAIGVMCKEGVAVLVVEQNIERALKVADSIHVMERGRIVLSGTAGSLSTGHQISDIIRGIVDIE